MSRQIQLRRGSADAHQTFIGADGEVTVDTTNKTLRVHDGVTPGGSMLARAGESLANADYVVEFQAPTAANGLGWYRKYKSGWVEQGGRNFGNKTVVFPIPMKNSDYAWTLNSLYDNANSAPYNELGELSTKTATGFTKAGNAQTFIWTVRGMAA